MLNTQGAATSLPEAVKQTQPDRDALNEIIADMIREQFTDDLRILDEIIKHTPNGGGPNLERLRQAYRSRILNTGNRLLREIPRVTGDFIIQQFAVYKRQQLSVPLSSDPSSYPSAPPLARLERMHRRRDVQVRQPDGSMKTEKRPHTA